MSNSLSTLSESQRWHLMVDAAKKAAEAQGYSMTRVPGRGLSNIWNIAKDGKTQTAAIRTTRDRYIAFPPLKGGTKWKTLDDVETVIVATVDSKEDPENVEVYIFPADDVRKRFNAHYAARSKEGQTIKDNFGMWVGLDRDNRGIAASVGTGILDHYKHVAVYAISDLLADNASEEAPDDIAEQTEVAELGFSTIAEVMAWARDRVAQLAGVQTDAVKLDLKIEY
ncbi:hypothetical protein EFV37_35910 (plasmid) [Mesorhizobium loti]|uniref:Uncharacterized protein n=1 Tax=Mesorhizobium jarvisii TaxID=1777867 RepID=A0A6M7TRU5_9HYPH|nr:MULTISPECIES: hypothetical protein [Mesorhizobium]OBQ66488.1 hypothetical protein A9K72_34625 [Mesorhizobium loti]QKC67659.1 hypothetical protein EB229_35870 [Mesorhizobium jarvisii]QKD13578.1 hypothetical protein EFV37_35910 [Mesorhizobium loti]RJT28183.1 hypothetical protein D3242_32990 [Mesorhizobium jarvisii]